MCVAATCRRRRRQAKNNYRHMAPLRRPHYKTSTADISAKRLQRLVENEKMRKMRKGNKK